MFAGLTVGVVVPAHNEADHITATLSGIPEWVDRIIVVDDACRDETAARVKAHPDLRVVLLRHRANLGVGGAILTGYREALRQGLQVAVVMAGDGQMDPADLPDLLAPLAAGDADYVKGNRFAHPDLLRTMPKTRLLGNFALSWITRPATGFPDIVDSQSGYTAIRSKLLQRIDFTSVYPRYGFPNDFLAHVHSAGGRVAQVKVRPIYAGEGSGIRPARAVLPLAWVMVRTFALRLWRERRAPVARVTPPVKAQTGASTLEVEATGQRR
jgi:glycosyltransferase involved in cell wall biosynthesis